MTNLRADPVWRDRAIIAVAYALAWGALLVNRGFYWDDWTLVGVAPASLIHAFTELGMPWSGYFYTALLSTPLPGLLGHVLTFVAYGLSTLVLHAILRRIPGLNRMDALIAALTFALLPVNFARVALIDLPYGLSLLAFLAATWLLVRDVHGDGFLRRVAALGLFIVAFSTASLLVLYAVPLGLAAVLSRRSRTMPWPTVARHYGVFVVLPVAYWLLKAAFFTPTGVYAGYNALSVSGLVHVPRLMLAIPGEVIVEPLVRAVAVAGLIGLVGGVAGAIWLVRRRRILDDDPLAPAPALALIGVVLLGLGVFAYLAVGRIPTIWDWSSRHQLLVPLGVGLLAAAAGRGTRAAGPTGIAVAAAVGLFLGVSAAADARTLLDYQADWFKQTALIDAARTIPAIGAARHIRVIDDATAFDTLDRTYRFYEYNALFEAALGDTRRLVSGVADEPRPDEIATFIARPAYHMGDYVPSPVDLEVRVSAPRGIPGTLEILRLILLDAAGSPSFGSDMAKLIRVEASPVAIGAIRSRQPPAP